MNVDRIIRTLIVDDESPARARIRQLLKDEPGFAIVGECSNGRQAVLSIQKQSPDLVFLDVQMPRMNGFEVCAALGEHCAVRIVFVTAYDQYALQAFEVHALDYLLKPFDRDRFQKTLRRVRDQIKGEATGVSSELKALLHELKSRADRVDRLAFKSDGRILFVRIEDIDWIEAAGNYVEVHVGTSTHLLRETLTWLEGRLPSDKFLRISRSVIVNLDRVKELQSLFYGDFAVILRDGKRLTMSRTYRDRLDKLLPKTP